jgi:hypothetical protein
MNILNTGTGAIVEAVDAACAKKGFDTEGHKHSPSE